MEETKNKNLTEEITDITKVIPVEYLRFQEDGYTFGYNGKEYGFFVCHRIYRAYKYIDIVIVDFTYDLVDAVSSIQAKLILQDTFVYSTSNNTESWKMAIGGEYNYYLTNPRFVSSLQNEHALNYGDAFYKKENDDGLIIYQGRLNYSGIKKVQNGITVEEGKALFKSALSTIVSDAIGMIPYVGTAFGLAIDISSFIAEFAQALGANSVNVPSNMESNIFQQQSKEAQKYSDLPSYTRLMLMAPEESIVLTDSSDSFIKCYTLLNDTNHTSRLFQEMQFDIIRTNGEITEQWTYMNSINEDGSRIPFYTYQEKILYENYAVQGIATEQTVDYYLLENGNQRFIFMPIHSGYYIINNINDKVSLKVNGQSVKYGEEIYLQGGEKYEIGLSSNSKISGNLTLFLAELGSRQQTFDNSDSFWAKYVPPENVCILLKVAI